MGCTSGRSRPRIKGPAGSLWARRAMSHRRSSVAQRQSIRLLTGGLLVRIQPEEPIFPKVFLLSTFSGQSVCLFLCPPLVDLASGFAGRSSASTARRCAACPIWPYRLTIRTVVAELHPMTDATTDNGTPASSMRVTHVWRRSWKRTDTPALFLADSQASFHEAIGCRGSVA